MKDNLKNLIGLIALAVLMIAAIPANAQQYDYQSITYTNAIAASSTEAANSAGITLTKWGDLAIEVVGTNAQLDAGALVTVNLESSLDGSTWSSAVFQPVPFVQTAAFRLCTNINVGAIGYVRVTSVVNAATNALSGFSMRYGLKPKRYGN
jgi:hypothetical protein